jgi:hypothetical protein
VSRYDHPSATAALGTPVLATALHKKTAPPKIKKDGTVNVWLFLPSTVLTVSGSRGLLKNFESRNANFEILFRLSAASAAPPKRI